MSPFGTYKSVSTSDRIEVGQVGIGQKEEEQVGDGQERGRIKARKSIGNSRLASILVPLPDLHPLTLVLVDVHQQNCCCRSKYTQEASMGSPHGTI